jgi:hypothetical protein
MCTEPKFGRQGNACYSVYGVELQLWPRPVLLTKRTPTTDVVDDDDKHYAAPLQDLQPRRHMAEPGQGSRKSPGLTSGGPTK